MLLPPPLVLAALLQVSPAASPPPAARSPTPLRLWLVTAPVPTDTGPTRLSRDYLGGERTAFPDSDAAWRPIAAGEDGLVDLGSLAHRGTDNVVSYAFTYIEIQRDETALLVLASRDEVAAWLNGQRIYARPSVGDGGTERDTVIVRLAAGWNALLVKVVNRRGPFGFGAALSTGRTRLATANHRPAAARGFVLPGATVTAGPITVTAPPVWRGSSLDVRGTISLAAWGSAPIAAATVQLISGGDTLIRTVVQSLVPGATREVRLEMNLVDLADAAAETQPPDLQVLWRTPGQAAAEGAARGVSLPVLSAERIIAALDGRIDLDWSSEATVDVQIPRALAGLALDLVMASGSRRVCGPGACIPGDSLAIRRDVRTTEAAFVRIKDLTYTDVARNVALMPALGDSSTVPAPDARQWLAAMMRADKATYRRIAAQYDSLLAAPRRRWSRDTIDFVGVGGALPASDLGLWWSDPRASGSSGESLVRQGLYGQLSFQRRLGRRAQVVWGGPGATAYPRTLPQIWRGLGITAFVAPGLPEAGFFWEGIDGSRIFAYRLRETDGSGADLARQMAQSSHRLMVTYPASDTVLERRDDLRRLPAFPILRDATPEDALRGVRGARPDAAWPVWRGDIAPVDAGAPAPAAAVDENLLLNAETLAALDTAPYPRAELRRAWERGLSGDAGYAATATTLRDAAFRRLARALDTRDADGIPVVVFNPQASVRSSYATVRLDAALAPVRRERTLRAVDAARRATPAVFSGDSLRFLAREVPPLGFKVFWIRPGAASGGDTLVGTSTRLLAATEPSHDGPAGHSWSFASIDAEDVYVTALKRSEQTNAYVLRLVEWQGRPARVTVTFGRPVTRVRLANLLEDPAAGVQLARDRRSVTVSLRAWEIATLLVDQDR